MRIVRAMQPRAVMLVNDDADFLEALSTTLEGEGYPVVTAKGTEEALERMQYIQPVLIVADFHPTDDSPDLLSIMRERGLYEDVPKLVISGEPPEEIERRLHAARLSLPYLHKLTDLTLVLHAVESAFDASLFGNEVHARA